jgi:hypothetical protein
MLSKVLEPVSRGSLPPASKESSMTKSMYRLAVAALGVGLGVAGVAPAMAGTVAVPDSNGVIALPTITPAPPDLLGGLLGNGGLLDLGGLLSGSQGLLTSSGGLFGSQGGLIAGSSSVSDIVPLATGGLNGVPVLDGTIPGFGSVGPAIGGLLAGGPPVGGQDNLGNPAVASGLLGGLLNFSSLTGLLSGHF